MALAPWSTMAKPEEASRTQSRISTLEPSVLALTRTIPGGVSSGNPPPPESLVRLRLTLPPWRKIPAQLPGALVSPWISTKASSVPLPVRDAAPATVLVMESPASLPISMRTPGSIRWLPWSRSIVSTRYGTGSFGHENSPASVPEAITRTASIPLPMSLFPGPARAPSTSGIASTAKLLAFLILTPSKLVTLAPMPKVIPFPALLSKTQSRMDTVPGPKAPSPTRIAVPGSKTGEVAPALLTTTCSNTEGVLLKTSMPRQASSGFLGMSRIGFSTVPTSEAPSSPSTPDGVKPITTPGSTVVAPVSSR